MGVVTVADRGRTAWLGVDVLVVSDQSRARVAWVGIEVLSPLLERARVTWLGIDALVTSDVTRARSAWLGVEVLMTGDETVIPSVRVTGAMLEALVSNIRTPEAPRLSDYASIAVKRFGVDLVLATPEREVTATPTGDWPIIGGRPNLHAAVRRRMVASPGEMVHRPIYGAGMALRIGELNSPSERARLSVDARENLLRDPRIEEADVAVTASGADTVIAELDITPRGEIVSEVVRIEGSN